MRLCLAGSEAVLGIVSGDAGEVGGRSRRRAPRRTAPAAAAPGRAAAARRRRGQGGLQGSWSWPRAAPAAACQRGRGGRGGPGGPRRCGQRRRRPPGRRRAAAAGQRRPAGVEGLGRGAGRQPGPAGRGAGPRRLTVHPISARGGRPAGGTLLPPCSAGQLHWLSSIRAPCGAVIDAGVGCCLRRLYIGCTSEPWPLVTGVRRQPLCSAQGREVGSAG